MQSLFFNELKQINMRNQIKNLPTAPISNLLATVSNDIVDFTKAKIEEVENAMPFLLPIIDEDLTSMVKLDPKKEAYIRDILIEMKNMKGKVPTIADADAIRENISSYDALYDLEDAAFEFYQKVRRNRIDRGSKAYREAANFYHSLDMAIKAKVPGAAECKKRLSVYFEPQGTRSSKQAKTPPVVGA
jgi:hypothetical protein